MSTARIARGYNLLAASYDWIARAVYGKALRRAQSCFLAELPGSARVFVLGGGSGWFLEALMRQAQPQTVVYVELSSEMLRRSQVRLQRNLPEAIHNVQFIEGRAEEAVQWGEFDVIVTHCLLDMYTQPGLQALVTTLSSSLKADGAWYFSDFFIVERGWMRPVSRVMIWLMYRFFRFVCRIEARRLPDFEMAFRGIGFAAMATKEFSRGMIRAKLYRGPHWMRPQGS